MQQTPDSKRPARVLYATDDAKWLAVIRKDRRADGRFYFSVKTTGVYCLPSCPSRAALRKNVAFHASPDDAERAGFRSCKRCWPKGPSLADEQAAVVAKTCRLIESANQAPTLHALAKAAGMSPFHFHRVFKNLTGVTPKAYASACRAERVRNALPKRGAVTQAIYESGFNSNSRFYAQSTQTLGMTPTEFRNGGAGTTIRFAIGKCSLGSVLVASSGKGVCAISLGDDPDSLLRNFQDRFPKASLVGQDRKFERMVAQILGFIEAPKTRLELPLDIRGTAFQERVWRALCEIPRGSTVSYAGLAARIGQPKAVRAVAQACASNEIAVAIPCHRVVRQDGKLSGYRWGLARKCALLQREASARSCASVP